MDNPAFAIDQLIDLLKVENLIRRKFSRVADLLHDIARLALVFALVGQNQTADFAAIVRHLVFSSDSTRQRLNDIERLLSGYVVTNHFPPCLVIVAKIVLPEIAGADR